MNDDLTKLGKYISFLLRHHPETIGLTLDSDGYADIDDLIEKSKAAGRAFTRETLDEIVRTNDKHRYSLSADGKKIRASQGHSISVNLSLTPRTPPDILYHGTSSRFVPSIKNIGIKPMHRNHVHLSADPLTAAAVGSRHGGEFVVLTIDAKKMQADGIRFYLSDNGVWLTDFVPDAYITFD